MLGVNTGAAADYARASVRSPSRRGCVGRCEFSGALNSAEVQSVQRIFRPINSTPRREKNRRQPSHRSIFSIATLAFSTRDRAERRECWGHGERMCRGSVTNGVPAVNARVRHGLGGPVRFGSRHRRISAA